MVLRVPLQMHLFGPEWLQHGNIELLLWRFLARLACGRYYTTHWAVILLEILLLDIPRTVLGLHPVAEVLLHIFLLEWLCVVVRSEEAFLSIFPRMVLKERPLRVARKAMVLPECHGGLKTDNGQTTWLLPRWVIPRQVRLPTSVVLDQVKKVVQIRRLDLLFRRLLPWQIRRRLRSVGPEPIIFTALIKLNI